MVEEDLSVWVSVLLTECFIHPSNECLGSAHQSDQSTQALSGHLELNAIHQKRLQHSCSSDPIRVCCQDGSSHA